MAGQGVSRPAWHALDLQHATVAYAHRCVVLQMGSDNSVAVSVHASRARTGVGARSTATTWRGRGSSAAGALSPDMGPPADVGAFGRPGIVEFTCNFASCASFFCQTCFSVG